MGQPYTSRNLSPVMDPVRMADRIMQFAPASDAEALKLLRSSFPDHPLSMRVAALDFLLRRSQRNAGVKSCSTIVTLNALFDFTP
jgi:hypothetical protein